MGHGGACTVETMVAALLKVDLEVITVQRSAEAKKAKYRDDW